MLEDGPFRILLGGKKAIADRDRGVASLQYLVSTTFSSTINTDINADGTFTHV
jgi:hypothetical protein